MALNNSTQFNIQLSKLSEVKSSGELSSRRISSARSAALLRESGSSNSLLQTVQLPAEPISNFLIQKNEDFTTAKMSVKIFAGERIYEYQIEHTPTQLRAIADRTLVII
eukprot:TRINITY_DN5780_c1_g1_i1.p1 TRINITY_DN5780_c1_g1~~TRINITY_DN5780_c1_g1_i1.p1  ORF type:complete len:109 (-),score=44.91 TRINITY_DN5780_c1_g1_i1:88-414(-)